jgi:hypothetical protein
LTVRALLAIACAIVAPAVLVCACGESRRPIGEECLRNEDCLSNFCAARSCVPAPSLMTGAGEPPDDEEPLIPTNDGGGASFDATTSDAKADGQ